MNTKPKNGMRPIHPGEILKKDYLEPLGMTANALATALAVLPQRIYNLVKGTGSVTPDTALRLERFFGASAQSWLNLQTTYDLKVAERELSKTVAQEVKPMKRGRA